MPNDNDGRSAPRDVSRRHLFKQVGLAGAAAAVTATARASDDRGCAAAAS